MQDIKIEMRRSDLWVAARQEALRWQGFVARVPLFLGFSLVLSGILFGVGFGFLKGFQELSIPLQGLVLIGYSVVYWGAFTFGRFIQAWFRARRMGQALFRSVEVAMISLSLGEKSLHLDVGAWETTIPRPQVYMTQDFVFLDTPFIPWLPLRRSMELNTLIAEIRNPGKKKGADQAPSL